MMVYARGSSQCNPLVMGLTSQSLHLGVYILKPSPCQVFFALSSFLQLSFASETLENAICALCARLTGHSLGLTANASAGCGHLQFSNRRVCSWENYRRASRNGTSPRLRYPTHSRRFQFFWIPS